MALEVLDLDAAWRERYDAFCASRPEAFLYHGWKYRLFLEALLGCRARYLGAVEGGRLRAVLPLMEKAGPFGAVLNSLPFFGSYGGVLAADEAAGEALWRAYGERARAPGVAAATVIASPLHPSAPPLACDMEDERIGQLTELPRGADAQASLLALMAATARRNLRAAQRAGITVEVDNDALGELRVIHEENMQAIGGRTKPAAFFTLLPRHFVPDTDYRLYVGRLHGEVVSALLVFYFGGIVEYYMPATRLSHRAEQPSALLLWQAMSDAARLGFRLWNWGGTWKSQEGVLRFKRKWGAQDVPYRYYTVLRDNRLQAVPPAELMRHYDYFYVLPFERQRAKGAQAE